MTFSNPDLLWFGAGILILLMTGLWSHAGRRRRLGELLGGPRAARRVADSNLYRFPRDRVLLLGLAALALTLAAGEPFSPAPPPVPPRPPRSVVLAIDISGSMQATDLRPNRLAHAVRVAHDVIATVPRDRVGLLLFAGTGYLLAPPTRDHAALAYLLRGVTPGTASVYDPGSRLSAGVAAAVAALEDTPATAERSIVLIGDGESGEPERALRAAVQAAVDQGIRVHTVGVGTARGGGMVMPDGNFRRGGPVFAAGGAPAVSRLREATLARVAEWGTGRYARSDDPAGVFRLHDALQGSLQRTEPESRAVAPWRALDLGAWLALAGLVCLVLEGLLGVRLPRILFALRRAA